MSGQPPINPTLYHGPSPSGNNRPVPPVTSQPIVLYPNQLQGAVIPVTEQNKMGFEPCIYVCKSCNIQIVTRVERKPARRTHIAAGVLCLLCCWPCALFPYCMHACNDVDHYCSHCGSYIGSYTG